MVVKRAERAFSGKSDLRSAVNAAVDAALSSTCTSALGSTDDSGMAKSAMIWSAVRRRSLDLRGDWTFSVSFVNRLTVRPCHEHCTSGLIVGFFLNMADKGAEVFIVDASRASQVLGGGWRGFCGPLAGCSSP